MTKVEAERQVEEMNWADWWCPLAGDRCNQECICYQKPYVSAPNPPSPYDTGAAPEYYVYGNSCSCYAFSGPVQGR